MVLIRECDALGNVHVPQNAQERIKLWVDCMKACKGYLGRTEFDHIIKEVYSDMYSPLNEAN